MDDERDKAAAAYAAFLELENEEAPPLDPNAVDPLEDDDVDINDDADDTDDTVKGSPMNLAEMRKGLETLAEDENAPEEERETARKALAAMEAQEPGEEEPPPPPDDEEEEGEEPTAECDKDRAQAAAPPAQPQVTATSPEVIALAAKVQTLEANEERRSEAKQRRKLLAQRPDFAAEVVALVKTFDLKSMEQACRPPAKAGEKYDPKTHGLPRGPGSAPGGQVAAARAAINAAPTIPANAPQSPPSGAIPGLTYHTEDATRMDRVMGFQPITNPIENDGTTVVMRPIKRSDALELARKGAK